MNETNHPQADDRLARLLAATNSDAAPTDSMALSAIRERSTAQLTAADVEPVLTHEQRSTQFMIRALIALAATAAIIIIGLVLESGAPRPSQRSQKAVANLTLGEAIRNLEGLDSFEAQILGGTGPLRIYGSKRGRWRVERSPTQYDVLDRGEMWRVDEAENRATRSASSYYSSGLGATDPLRLMEFDVDECLKTLPTEEQNENGQEALIYHWSIASKDNFNLSAVVDRKTQVPVSMAVTFGQKQQWAQFNLLATQAGVDQTKFQVPATLTADGRIGKITDHQGLVSLRPLTSTRWTPVCGEAILRPGDWLRTDFQGANAVTVHLAPQTKLILGPGSLMEFKKPDQFVLHSGIAEITPSPKSDGFSGVVKLMGHTGQAMEVGSLLLVRADEQGLTRLMKDPPWLAGYKSAGVQESLGSLVAKIDGREVPLTVGYHKVSVEIRDQIARTTIEESFVNHTDQQLEGQFHFPLPADASISGFGMWIGDKLVEADIVEKQRAREIYETILREKRDPGLLEWTGGNIFKARVYPIFAKSEKRIKIVYTQVLPRKGASYRYSYALQSELLRQNPLRLLDLDVTIASTQPLAAVESPTHLTRNQLTPHAARVEFSAQNYSPSRDFEVVATVDGKSPEVTFIPHQRGDDGYFLLMLQPPSEAGAWQRDVLPTGEPLNLIVLADTSASMDKSARRNQSEFVAALLGSLSPQDHFQLACCDVDCVWATKGPQAAEETNIAAARTFLAPRRSLGWTDLDKAFSEVLQRATPGTHVIYVGDGMVTNVGADGVSFTQRVAQAAAGKGVTCHTIAVSSSFDLMVLRGIASVGGGSLRTISGENGPQATARDLLAEITRPALKNIQVEFKGLRTARVYPRTLPNIPTGTQQILLGRYLPEGKEQQGEVIVTGMLDGKPATFRTGFTIQEGSKFNVQRSKFVSGSVSPSPPPPLSPSSSASDDASFIPRLWSRLHLDELLAQGGSQQIQDEIITLSEEFHIITPYTSLLVLESDADRERFKVKKRFQIRDGERFFAAGRDDAQYSLVQQQIRAAGLWRAGLRRSVLAQLAALGRDAQVIPSPRYTTDDVHNSNLSWMYSPSNEFTADMNSRSGLGDFDDLIRLIKTTTAPQSWDTVAGPGAIDHFEGNLSLVVSQTQDVTWDASDLQNLFLDATRSHARRLDDTDPRGWEPGFLAGNPFSYSVNGALDGTTVKLPSFVYDSTPRVIIQEEDREALGIEMLGDVRFGFEKRKSIWDVDDDAGRLNINEIDEFRLGGRRYKRLAAEFIDDLDVFRNPQGSLFAERHRYKSIDLGKSYWAPGENLASSKRRSGLLPIALGPAPRPTAAAQNAARRKATWPANVMQIVDALKSGVELANLAGGVAVEEQVDHYESHRGRLTNRTRAQVLISAGQWVIQHESDNGQFITEFCDSAERGIASLPYELKLVRKSEPTDLLKTYKPGDRWRELKDRSDSTVEMEQAADGNVLLVIRPILHPQDEERVLIDVAKHAVLSVERRHYGQPRSKEVAQEFVEIGVVWLPQRLKRYNDEGRLEQVVTRKYILLATDAFAARATDRRAKTNDFLALKLPFVSLDDAKAAKAAGRARLEDRLVILQDFANLQQWPEASAELETCEKLATGKGFAVWMRLWLLEQSRRQEELRQLVLSEAARLAEQPRLGEWSLVRRLSETAATLESSEQLAVLEALRPVYARRPEHCRGLVEWLGWKAARLYATGHTDEQLALLREAAARYPNEREFQINYAQRLRDGGDYAAAYSWFKAALAHPQANWPPSDRDAIYRAHAEMLREQGRYAEIVDLVTEWTAQQPENSEVYALHYAALVYCGRYDEGDRLLAGWFADGLAARPLAKAATARLSAAIQTARGGNSRLGNGDSQPQWYDELAAVLLAHVERDESQSIVSEVNGDWHFRESEPYRAASRQIAARLKEQVATLPVGALSRLIDWAASASASGYGAGDEEWKAIATTLRQRWDAATHPVIEETLTRALLTAYGRIGQDERLAFLRLRLEKSDDENRSSRVRELFNALLEQSWTTESEGESLGLIDKLATAADPARGLREQITALYRWTDRMEQARFQKYESEIERPDKLTRKELAEKRIANRHRARSELSDRLATAAKDRPDGLRCWLLIERLHLEILVERELSKVAESCFELLGPQPPAPQVSDAEWTLADWLDLQFRVRLVTMLTYLAANKETQAAVAERLTRYLDAMIAQDADGTRPGLDGRVAKYKLLVVLDQLLGLTESLSAWAQQVKHPQRWQRTLAYLHAELGQLDQAVLLADALSKNDALTGPDYRKLALWHQALGHKQQYEQSLISAYKQLDEYSLQRLIDGQLRPWQNTQGPTPGTIDPQVFLMQQALFEKASRPQDYVRQMRSFYEASRDFRCLAALADGVVGQSALNVYQFLEQIRMTLNEIDLEATADELVQHIATLRERAKTPVDQRALDLLEMLVERRAAEVQNQPGPHVDRAIAALQRAEKRDWSPGEPRLMAEMLAYLRGNSQPPLTDEALRVLTGLHASAKTGSLERLQIAQSLAAAQINNNRREQAISILESAISEYRHVVNDKTTADLVEALDMLARFYGDAGQFVRAEAVLQAELPRATNLHVADQLTWRIYSVHIRALASNGATSLGSGHALYRAVATDLRRATAETPDQRQRKRLIDKLCELYRTAHDLKLPTVEIDARTFANVLVPQLLASQVNEYQEIVSNVSGTLRTVVGPRDALALLIARIEAEPRWLAMQGDSGWRKSGYTLGDLREEVKTLADLEPRLLALVVAELRREMATQQSRHRVMYRRDYSHFWKEKRDDFARVAEEVLKTQPESQPGLLYIAEYLFDGLDLRDRAIEVLLDAHRRQKLDDEGRSQLVHYLHQASRYGESVPLLEGLIERHPEQLGNRTRLMYAYHQTKRPDGLLALLAATDKFFHEKGRWNEQVAGQLADGCRDCELFVPAVEYYQEAIARRRESLGGHLTGDQRLAQYHAEQAYSYAGLKNTKAAVDAACEAMVVTGTPANGVSTRQRGSISPVEVLRDVVRQSPQLDAYVAELDQETAQSHEDRAVVRKAIGEILFERMAYGKAVMQLKLAAEMMPADAAIYSKLVACYDGLADRPAAVDQLFASLEITRRDVELWAALSQRLEALGQTAEAERARTSLVETLPNETEGHIRLAQIRQEQDRWDDAILHWREVARLRKLEPAGLLSLARAQLHQQQWSAADETLKQLERTDWPTRYQDELRQKLPQLRDQWRKR